jgi:hypothetical protein
MFEESSVIRYLPMQMTQLSRLMDYLDEWCPRNLVFCDCVRLVADTLLSLKRNDETSSRGWTPPVTVQILQTQVLTMRFLTRHALSELTSKQAFPTPHLVYFSIMGTLYLLRCAALNEFRFAPTDPDLRVFVQEGLLGLMQGSLQCYEPQQPQHRYMTRAVASVSQRISMGLNFDSIFVECFHSFRKCSNHVTEQDVDEYDEVLESDVVF